MAAGARGRRGHRIGWGLVTNGSASWLTWQGYLLDPFGLGGKQGAWAFATLGVLDRAGHRLVVTLRWFSRSAVRAEESRSLPAPAARLARLPGLQCDIHAALGLERPLFLPEGS